MSAARTPIRAMHWLPWVAALFTAFALQTAQAGVPHEAAVPAYAEEQTILQLEQGLPEPGLTDAQTGIQHVDRHFIVPPGRMVEQNVILQRGGNTWRVLRNGPIAVTTAVVLLGTLLLIWVFYRVVGPSTPPPESGRKLLRFTGWQRLVHWATAIAFVLLALTGLILMYGKKLLLPWMGHDLFSWVAIVSKYLHNVTGPVFIGLTLLMFFTFLRQNYFRASDWSWLKKGGGMLTHRHVPADYFNAGEKLWFWLAVTGLGVLMAVTGLMLNFPYLGDVGAVIGFGRYLLQWADYLHIAGATLYIAATFGHIYLGTIGTPGAWGAMRHGTVDENWAQAHHEVWYDEVKKRPRHGAPGERLVYDRPPHTAPDLSR